MSSEANSTEPIWELTYGSSAYSHHQNTHLYCWHPSSLKNKYIVYFGNLNDETHGFFQLQREMWTIAKLLVKMIDNKGAFCWLAKRRLLHKTCSCKKCNILCQFHNYQQGLHGKRQACQTCGCERVYWKAHSLQKAIFFFVPLLPFEISIAGAHCSVPNGEQVFSHFLSIFSQQCLVMQNFSTTGCYCKFLNIS